MDDDVEQSARLQLVGGNNAQEVAVLRLLAQVLARGGVADLRDVEERQQVLDLDGDAARSGSDQSGDGILVVRLARVRLTCKHNSFEVGRRERARRRQLRLT